MKKYGKFQKKIKLIILVLSFLSFTYSSYAQDGFINVVSWNMLNLGNSALKKTERMEGINNVLIKMKPEIFLAQEILTEGAAKELEKYLNSLPSQINKSDKSEDFLVLSESLKSSIHSSIDKQKYAHKCSVMYGNRRQGNCIFWNISEFKLLVFEELDQQKSMQIKLEQFYQHAPIIAKLEFINDKVVNFKNKNVCVVSAHISFHKNNKVEIAQEIDSLFSDIEKYTKHFDCDYYLLGGDFNANSDVCEERAQEVLSQKPSVYIIKPTSRDKKGKSVNNYDHFIIPSSLSIQFAGNGSPHPEYKDVEDEETTINSSNNDKPIILSDHYPIFVQFDLRTDKTQTSSSSSVINSNSMYIDQIGDSGNNSSSSGDSGTNPANDIDMK